MGYNILLVDDDMSQLRVLERMVANKVRYQTKQANSGQEAVEMLSSPLANEIDLVILDLAMPGLDGVNVLRQVKAVRPNVPFIVRTGYNDTVMVANAMREGAEDFVHKLDSAEKLKQAIERSLAHKKHRDHSSKEQERPHVLPSPSLFQEQKEQRMYDKVREVLELQQADGHVKKLEDLEKEVITFALKRYKNHMSKVARHLSIGRSTLYRKLDHYNIDYPKRTKADDSDE